MVVVGAPGALSLAYRTQAALPLEQRGALLCLAKAAAVEHDAAHLAAAVSRSCSHLATYPDRLRGPPVGLCRRTAPELVVMAWMATAGMTGMLRRCVRTLAGCGLGGPPEALDLHEQVPADAASQEERRYPGEGPVLAEDEGDHRSLFMWLHQVAACGGDSRGGRLPGEGTAGL